MALDGPAIRKQTFRKKLQGFDPSEVALFLEEVAAEVDRLATENAGLSRRAAESEAQLNEFRSVEKALQQTLMQAQDSSARTLEQARAEAQLIIRDAQAKGAEIVEKSRSELSALKEQITILATKRESLVARLKALLTSELEMVKGLESADHPAAPPGAAFPAPDEARSAEIDDIVKRLDEL